MLKEVKSVIKKVCHGFWKRGKFWLSIKEVSSRRLEFRIGVKNI